MSPRCGQPGCPYSAAHGLPLCEGCWALALGADAPARAPLADVLRDVAATINADPSPEGLARTERECMEALFPGSTARPPLPPVAPGAPELADVRKALDTRWALLRRCRALLGALQGAECEGRLASGHYTLRDFHLGDVAALLVAIDLEGETADPLTGERP